MAGFLHPALGAKVSPEVTLLVCRLPLVTFTPSTRGYSPRTPDADIGTDHKQRKKISGEASLQTTKAPNGTKSCAALSMCSGAFLHLKCSSMHQLRQKEKRTLHGLDCLWFTVVICFKASIPRLQVPECWLDTLSPNSGKSNTTEMMCLTRLSKEVFLWA